MAMSFGAFAVPNDHIDFLAAHPGTVHGYLEGVAPKALAAGQVPAWWPTTMLESMGGWSINHRNVDLYHWILHGGPEPVDGAGAIFQAWYAPVRGVVGLDASNERFALHAHQLSELLALVERVTVDSVLVSFRAWLANQGKSGDTLDVYACQPFVDEFTMFADGLREAIARGEGIVW